MLWERGHVAPRRCSCGRARKLLVQVTSTVPAVWTTTMPNHPLVSARVSPAFHIQRECPSTYPSRAGARSPFAAESRERTKHREERYFTFLLTARTVVPRFALAATQLYASCCHSLSAYPEPCRTCVWWAAAHALARAYTSNSRSVGMDGMLHLAWLVWLAALVGTPCGRATCADFSRRLRSRVPFALIFVCFSGYPQSKVPSSDGYGDDARCLLLRAAQPFWHGLDARGGIRAHNTPANRLIHTGIAPERFRIQKHPAPASGPQCQSGRN